jgi:hypothetical protein
MAWVDKVTASGGNTAKFDKVGDSVEGLYIGVQYDANGKFGPTNKHLLKTPKGVTVVYAKPNSQLNDLFDGETGNEIRITFVDTKPSNKGNPQKLYKLSINDEVDRTPADELPTFEANAEDEEDDNQVGEEPTQSYDRPTRKTPDKANVEALLARNKRN